MRISSLSAASRVEPLAQSRIRPANLSRHARESATVAARAVEAERERSMRRQQARRTAAPGSPGDTGRDPDDSSTAGPIPQERPEDDQRDEANRASGEGENGYELRMVVQPPAQTRPGMALYPPAVLRLEQGSSDREAGDDPGRVWAFASLTTEDGGEVLAPPRTDLLRGSLVDSAHLVGDELDPGDAEAATARSGPITSYLVFPGLIIQEPGRYRIQITLGRMGGAALQRPTSLQGAMILQNVQSRIVCIADDAVAEPLNVHERDLLERLQSSDIAIPSSPAERS
ncbi:MAG: hypothetical protein M1838_001290 [Thelocarpon superellum]|nr:MAG: hypothetical protein M1838_001290 [Thelocarpon superellum]